MAVNNALTAVNGAFTTVNGAFTTVNGALTTSIFALFYSKRPFDGSQRRIADRQRRIYDDHRSTEQAVFIHNQLFMKNTQQHAQEHGRKKNLSAAAIQCRCLRLKKYILEK